MKLKFLVKKAIIILLIYGCSSNEDFENENNLINNSKNKILCIGDSRVEGDRPNHESYRYELWKKLVDSRKEFDFIGPFRDSATYPEYHGLSFDNDHAGIGGDTSQGVLDRYNDNVNQDKPDIVLLGIGGNDITSNTSIDDVIQKITSILDVIKNNNPNTTVIIEIIAGAKSISFLGQVFNNKISDFKTKLTALSNSKTSSNFKVIPVNMFDSFTNNIDYYADDIHYSKSGAKEIALRYYNALSPFLK